MFKFIKHFFADIKTDLFHSSLLLSGSLVAQVIAFLAYPVLTRLYSPAQFGEFSVFLSITGILIIVATGRLEYGLILSKTNKDAGNLMKLAFWWCFIFSSFCFILSMVLGLFVKVRTNIPGLYFIPLAVFISGAIQILTFNYNRLKQYNKIVRISVTQNASSSGSKITFGLTGLSGVGLIWGSIVGLIITAIVAFRDLFKQKIFNAPEKIKDTLKEYEAFPKYRMVQALINTLSSNLPILFLTFYFSAKEAGYYALVFGLAIKIITLISSSLYQVLYRRFSELHQQQKPIIHIFSKIVILLLIVSAIPGAFIFIFAKPLLLLLLGNNWLETTVYIKMMMPWLILVFITSPFAFIADVYSFQKKVLMLDILYLIIRALGLYLGFWLNNVYLSILFYSLGSSCVQLYLLGLYYQKIKTSLVKAEFI